MLYHLALCSPRTYTSHKREFPYNGLHSALRNIVDFDSRTYSPLIQINFNTFDKVVKIFISRLNFKFTDVGNDRYRHGL